MDKISLKAQVKATFDTVSDGYDSRALRFFSKGAVELACSLDLNGDERVLDVATGTGHTALTIAAGIPQGQATGIDLSPAMLERARQKASAQGLGNIEFIEMDMEALEFAAGSFDVATCAFGIFFIDEIDSLLSHIAQAVASGGKIATVTFQEDYFQPLAGVLFNRLAGYGVDNPPQNWKRVATEAGCRALFEQAGLNKIRVEPKNVGYHLESAEEWWDIVWNAGYRRLVSLLAADEQKHFKDEHLAEIETLRTPQGIWLDAGILITIGAKP